MKDTFSKMHPVVNLLFFTAVIAFSMFQMNPVCLMISAICATANAVYLNGKKTARLSVRFLLPTAILVCIINPLFNHRGATVIEYFPWGNPLTLESVAYGFASAVLLCSVVLWFSCVNKVMTSDKLVYIFGRVSPALSLVLSMALRRIPYFFTQFRQVRQAQKQMYVSSKSLASKFKGAVRVFSIMITWSMENSIKTADSMKSRGYGLKGRTSFSIYRFDLNDLTALSAIMILASALTVMTVFGAVKFRYFPTIKRVDFDLLSAAYYMLYALLMLIPLIINVREEIKWARSRSKI